MGVKKNNYSVTENSQTFPFLPQPEDYGVLKYLTSFGHEYLKSDYFLEREGVDIYMINYVVSGSLTLALSGNVYQAKKGSLCMIYLGNNNVIYPNGGGAEIYYFHVKGAKVREFYNQITKSSDYVFDNFPLDIVENTFEKMKNQIISSPSFFTLSKICNDFLTDVLEFSIKKEKENFPDLIFKTLLAIRVSENQTANDIAKKLGFNPIYLERVFKKHTGKTIKQAIIERNIERAQNLLLTTNMSVLEIAEAVGYSNANGLITLFKKHLGVTPLEFRKTNANF